VFLVFLFKINLDLNLCNFWLLILCFFILFYFIVKIDKLIKFFFLNLDADVAFCKIKFIIFILMATSAFSLQTVHSVCHVDNFR